MGKCANGDDCCLCTVCVCVNVSLAPSTGACLVLMTNSLLA